MDYKELMCGDYVKAILPTETVIVKVLGVCEDYINYEVVYSGVRATDQINPDLIVGIPVNSYALVLNGFDKQGDLYQYHIDAGDGYIRVDLTDLGGGEWMYDIDVYDKFNDSHNIRHNDSTFLKLHQLQHLLRDCEISKEITT